MAGGGERSRDDSNQRRGEMMGKSCKREEQVMRAKEMKHCRSVSCRRKINVPSNVPTNTFPNLLRYTITVI